VDTLRNIQKPKLDSIQPLIPSLNFDILEVSEVKIAHIELTSRCNLRCVYCAVSQSDYQGIDANLDELEPLVEELIRLNVKVVSLNGHGETTILPRWQEVADRLIDSGVWVALTTNLSKKYKRDELKTLSRIPELVISCDTFNPALYKKLRRGAYLDRLLGNLKSIQELRQGSSFPFKLGINTVVFDKNVYELPKIIRKSKEIGFDRIVLINYNEYPSVPGALRVRHVTELNWFELIRARRSIKRAIKLAHQIDLEIDMNMGLLDSINAKLKRLLSFRIFKPMKKTIVRGAARRTADMPLGYTRNCLDPWRFLMIGADKTIQPCCWRESICKTSEVSTGEECINHIGFKKLRAQIYTGDLDKECISCPARGAIPISEFQSKLKQELKSKLDWLPEGFQ